MRSILPGKLLFFTLSAVIGGSGLSYLAWRYTSELEHAQLSAQFDRKSAEVQAAIESRFHAHEQILRSGTALLSSFPDLSRDHWREFVARLQVAKHYPGIQGIGYAVQLSHATLQAHVNAVRREGFPDYQVHPLNSARAPTSIVFLEPFNARNQRAFGYDMYSEPIRRAAMARARDSGEPALSGQVILLQETDVDRQAGTLLYLPLYHHGLPIRTVAERRAALRGWVYSPFRMRDLMQGILGDDHADLGLRLYSGATADHQKLLFTANAFDSLRPPRFQRDTHLTLAGQPWVIAVTTLPGFGAGMMAAPNLVLICGLILTLALCIVVFILLGAEDRAQHRASEMTQALRHNQECHAAILQNTADGILTIDSNGGICSFNAAAENIFGYVAQEVLGRKISLLMPARHVTALKRRMARLPTDINGPPSLRQEVTGLRRDGSEFPVWLAVNRMPVGEPHEYVAMVSDISQRKSAEFQLAEANRLRRSILRFSPFAIIATDADGVIRSINPAAERLLGYRDTDVIGILSLDQFHDPEELCIHSPGGGITHLGMEILFSRARRGEPEEGEWTYVTHEGRRVPVQVAINAMRDSRGEVAGFLAIAFDITDRVRTQACIQHMAHHDALTDLPNRVLLQERLEQALLLARGHKGQVAVLMLDLDHFKRINDSLGHHIGDDLLLQVAERLTRSLRRIDFVARTGGDEFVVILPGVREREGIDQIIEKLSQALCEPLHVDQHEIIVTASIGVCLYPRDGKSVRELLKNADTAMYRAKDAGRGSFKYFRSQMLEINEQRLATEAALRKALQFQELSLAYQPQVDMRSGEWVGCEALLRWKHPQLGQVAPIQFIPLAEEMGLIQPIGEWVIREACRQASEFRQRLGRDLSIAVNISPHQIFRSDLVHIIQSALRESGLPPECLEIELTEGVVIHSTEQTVAFLRQVRNLGVSVAIDDFGTGYSSLAYLTRFPIDKLKIDQSFIRDLFDDASDAAIASAILVMAHALKLSVTAEGVETPQQLAFLQERHCDQAQGYYFSPPISAAEFERSVRSLRTAVGGGFKMLPGNAGLH